MFEVGEYVVYGSKGVCRIEDIAHIDISGSNNERLYYVLTQIGDNKGKIYAPTDNEKTIMRKVISKDEATELIRELPGIGLLLVPNEKQREVVYKEALWACDNRARVSIVKTLYLRRKERIAKGKRATALDERYMRVAESELYNELSIALDVPKKQMEDYIREQLQMVQA